MRHSSEDQFRVLLDHIAQSEKRLMAAIDTLNTSVTNNTAATAALQTAVTNLQANIPTDNDPAILAAAAQIDTNTAANNAAATTIAGLVPAPAPTA